MPVSNLKLGELLVDQGLIKREDLEKAVEHQTQHKTRLSNSLVTLGHINERTLAAFLSKQYGIPAISLRNVTVDPKLVKIIPRILCEKHHFVPLTMANERVSIALSDPTDLTVAESVRFLTGSEPILYLATESGISQLIRRAYGGPDEASAAAQGSEPDSHIIDATKSNPLLRLEGQQNKEGSLSVSNPGASGDSEKPVIRLINELLTEGVKRKASDIHIEPFETYARVRYRVDGALYEIMKLPKEFKTTTAARIKVMADMDISEKRLPQDGRIQFKTKTGKIDVRVSTLPTMFGEKVVMRLLDQGGQTPDLNKVGFEPEQLEIFRKAANQPYGMVLVTGPTGSGKSTTLYGVLSELNQPDVNISTVEDPVEYNMMGVNQVQMKEAIGMGFAAALKSLLRQDPDIIMIGEIRDQESAEIAVKAALTGHMVFSTLHTNDAPGTISRLLHIGLEPFLITAALTLVEAQRLIRVLCPHCSEPDTRVTEADLKSAEVPQDWMGKFTPMRGRGCGSCGNTGYAGRKGIYEVMPMTENLRNLIIKGANTDNLKSAALAEGFITLRKSALLKFYRGQTSLEEVLNNSRPDGDLIRK